MKTLFYNLRDYASDPRVVVCLVEKDGKYGRGIAICDFSDKFDEKRGRRKAHKRAMRALNTSENSSPICSEDAKIIMSSVERMNTYVTHKSQFTPMVLTLREVNILDLIELTE